MQGPRQHTTPPAPGFRWQLGQPWGPSARTRAPAPDRPFVFLNVAITADGKIAPGGRHFEPFGSKRDQGLLYELRTHADAVLCGARTIDLNPVKLGNGGDQYTRLRRQRHLDEFPLRIIVSGHATVDPRAEIFKHRFSPIIILASRSAPERRLRKLRGLADEVALFGDEQVDFPAALRWLREKWQVKRLLSEGGGEINGALFRAGLVDEFYLTICPIVFGGRKAPTPVDGDNVLKLSESTPVAIRAMKRVGAELFLACRVIRSRRPQKNAVRPRTDDPPAF